MQSALKDRLNQADMQWIACDLVLSEALLALYLLTFLSHVSHLFLSFSALNGWKDNQYGIGYLDAGHGHDFGLSEVALTNLAGQTRTSKESIALGGVAEAGTAAANGNVFPTDVSADWSRDSV